MSIVDEITRLTSAKTNIKAAIEAKGVSVPSSAHLDAFPSYVSAISGGGGSELEDGLLEGTLTSYTNSRISYVRWGGFFGTPIKDLNLPNVTAIGRSAFMWAVGGTLRLPNLNFSSTDGSTLYFESATFSRVEMDSLVYAPGSMFWYARVHEVYAPNLVRVGTAAFANCSSLQAVPNESNIQWTANSAFRAVGISELIAPNLQGVNPYAFSYCSKLTYVSLNRGSYLAYAAFAACSALATVYAPLASYVSTSCFYSCYALSSVTLTACRRVGSSAFYRCSALSTLTLPECDWIDPNAFASCTTLFSLYMLSTSRATLYLVNAFSNTPMSASVDGVYGSIFVRQSLLTQYQSATQWAAYSKRMVGLTDEEIAALT